MLNNKNLLSKLFSFCMIICLGNIAFYTPNAAAQDVSAIAKMDSVAMLIGHQTKLTIELSKPADAIIAFPIVLDTLVDKVEVLERGLVDTVFLGNNREVLTQELLITSFDSGFYYLPPFEFEIQNGGGTIESNPLALKMYTYQIDSIQGLFDVKPVKEIPYQFREFAPYLAIWLGVALLVLLCIFLYRSHKNKTPLFAPPPKPKEPAYITAFRELERMRVEKLWQAGKEKEYYTDLSVTLRTYIEGRFDVLAMEQTSDEILRDIKDKLNAEEYKRIKDVFEIADLVKFAKMIPPSEESERCIKDVYAFVDKTKFVPEIEVDEEEAENVDSSENA